MNDSMYNHELGNIGMKEQSDDYRKGYSEGVKEALAYKDNLDEILSATRALVASRGRNSELVEACKTAVEEHFAEAIKFEKKSGASVGNAEFGKKQFYNELKDIEAENE